MSRYSLRLHGGRHGSVQSSMVSESKSYLQAMPGNPYLFATHDGLSSSFGKGYSSKAMNWLYRFRYNVLPVGTTTGFYQGNLYAKHVHWLEVSTIERVRVQVFGEEAIPILWLSIGVFAFTFYHSYRAFMEHRDISTYTLASPLLRSRVQYTRFHDPHPMDEPLPYKYFQRCPEWFAYDGYKELVKLDLIANDPFLDRLRAKGLIDEATMPATDVVTGGRGDVLSKVWDEKRSNLGFTKPPMRAPRELAGAL